MLIYYCKKANSFLRDPSCNQCESSFCYVKPFRKAGRETRKRLELERIARMVAPSRTKRGEDGFKLKALDFLIGLTYLPGLVMLMWIPFIFVMMNPPVPIFSWNFWSSVLIFLLISIGIHELGHLAIVWFERLRIEEWRLVPIGIGFRISENVGKSTSLKVYTAGPMANLATALVAGFCWHNPLAYFLLLSSLFLFLMNGLPHPQSDGFKIGLTLAKASDVYTYLYAASFFIFIPFSLFLALRFF